MPTLALIFRIAEALGCAASVLIADTESNLNVLRRKGQRSIRVNS